MGASSATTASNRAGCTNYRLRKYVATSVRACRLSWRSRPSNDVAMRVAFA
jgi:hypothetical protein